MRNPLSSIVFILLGWMLLVSTAQPVNNKAYLIEVDDAIGPASQDLIVRAIKNAESRRFSLIILRLNTPGGLDFSMRKIISAILDSDIPVVTYISPAGARAASAGTYILFASHVAVMAPTTHLGAATPVQVGGLPKIPNPMDENQSSKPDSEAEKMEKKIINDAVAYIRGLAELHGRNAEWAQLAVTEAKTLTASEALEQNVIDFIATDIAQLLLKIDGLDIDAGTLKTTLNTQDIEIEIVEADWRNKLLSIITDPNIAYLLMLIGIYGLIFEFSSPGFVLPGVVGAICLILALYAFQILPVSFAGAGLVLVGLVFIIAEAFVASAGILGLGGLVAFVIGSIILFDDEYLAISLPLIGGLALVGGGFLVWMVSHLSSLRQQQVVSGAESMSGKIGYVMADFSSEGRVRFNGESWLAESSSPLVEGEKVRIIAVDGLSLKVEKA